MNHGEAQAQSSTARSIPAATMRITKVAFSRYSILIAIIVLLIVYSVLMPDTFATSRNFRSMLNSQSVLVLLAIGSTMSLRNGDFDLSLAATAIFSSTVLGSLTINHGVSLAVAVPIALVVGMAVGAFNALLVVVFDLDALIVTLGVFTLLNGLSLLVSDSVVLSPFPESLSEFSRHQVLSLPAATWYSWVVVLIALYVYEFTPLGRYMYFIGGNRETTRLAGIRVQRIRAWTFVVSGLLAAFAGVVLSGLLGGADPTAAGQYLLQPFAAAFLGATTFVVGRFNALGTVAALYFLVVGITGIQLLGFSGWVTNAFNGAALLLAISVAGLAQRRRRVTAART